MNHKKILLGVALLVALGLAQAAHVPQAMAKTTSTKHHTSSSGKHRSTKTKKSAKKTTAVTGKITGFSDTGILMSSKKDGQLTIGLTATTKLVDRNGMTLDPANVQIGDTIRVTGTRDVAAKSIAEATVIKDLSYPSSKKA